MTWLTDHFAIIGDLAEAKLIFKGVLRGEGQRPFTFLAPSMDKLHEELILEDWIYRVNAV